MTQNQAACTSPSSSLQTSATNTILCIYGLLCFSWDQRRGSTLGILAAIFNTTTEPEKEVRQDPIKMPPNFSANFYLPFSWLGIHLVAVHFWILYRGLSWVPNRNFWLDFFGLSLEGWSFLHCYFYWRSLWLYRFLNLHMMEYSIKNFTRWKHTERICKIFDRQKINI